MNLLALRHGEDEAVMDGTYDRPLVPSALSDILVLSSEVAEYYRRGNYKSANIYYSSKLRAEQTAKFIATDLSNKGMLVTINRAESISELYQGELSVDRVYYGRERCQPLVDAWSAYNVAVSNCDLLYRFGDPHKVSDNYVYPELLGHFNVFGENQREFSLRLYAFICDVVMVVNSCLPILVAHRATTTRLQRIIGVSNSFDSADVSPGKLRFLERRIDRVQTEFAEGVIIPVRSKTNLITMLHQEIRYLLTAFGE